MTLLQDAVLLFHRGAGDPVREVAGDVLLEDPLTGDAIRVAGHRDQPLAEVEQHPVGHLCVVLDEVALGDLIAGEQDLIRMGQVNLDTSGGQALCVTCDHDASLPAARRLLTTFPHHITPQSPGER
jgi:hypothetical protein